MVFCTECFNSLRNRFEQLCINYSNEKIQNFCTQRLIRDEQNWYKEEGVKVPEIPFPGNDMVLGKYARPDLIKIKHIIFYYRYA